MVNSGTEHEVQLEIWPYLVGQTEVKIIVEGLKTYPSAIILKKTR